MVQIGAHVSAAGGLTESLRRGLELGVDATQVHATPPQTWRRVHPEAEQLAAFHELYRAGGSKPYFLHSVYLINLATVRPDLLALSRGSLKGDLHLANELEVTGVIFHPGSHKGQGFEAVLPQMGEAMRRALQESDQSSQSQHRSLLLIENSAGAGDNVGSNFSQLRQMLEAVDSPRAMICLDTAHAFTAGYDLRTEEGLATLLEELEREVGLERLAVIHANDSKPGFGSNRDRHENIGDGEIGSEAFGRMLADPGLRQVPWILEVPGLEHKGPDRVNLDRLRALAGLPPVDGLAGAG